MRHRQRTVKLIEFHPSQRTDYRNYSNRQMRVDGASGLRFPVLADGAPGFTVVTDSVNLPNVPVLAQFTPRILATDLDSGVLRLSRSSPDAEFLVHGVMQFDPLKPLYGVKLHLWPNLVELDALRVPTLSFSYLYHYLLALNMARPRIAVGMRAQYATGTNGFYSDPQRRHCPNCGRVWMGEVPKCPKHGFNLRNPDGIRCCDMDRVRTCMWCQSETQTIWRPLALPDIGKKVTVDDAVKAWKELKPYQFYDGTGALFAASNATGNVPSDGDLVDLLVTYVIGKGG